MLTLARTLGELERQFVVLRVINRQRDSLELPHIFAQAFPDAVMHVVRNGYFGALEQRAELFRWRELCDTMFSKVRCDHRADTQHHPESVCDADMEHEHVGQSGLCGHAEEWFCRGDSRERVLRQDARVDRSLIAHRPSDTPRLLNAKLPDPTRVTSLPTLKLTVAIAALTASKSRTTRLALRAGKSHWPIGLASWSEKTGRSCARRNFWLLSALA